MFGFSFFKPKDDLKQMPLPLNMPEFEEWSDRIITKAALPTKNLDSQKFALAGMILQSSPHDYLRPDLFYINLLKKAAADQVALQAMEDMKLKRAQKLKSASEAPTTSEPTIEKDMRTLQPLS